MLSTTVIVKNMVCNRCILVVEEILRKESIRFKNVTFGEIYLVDVLTQEQENLLSEAFITVGFEMIDNHSSALIEKIKQLVIKRARNETDGKEINIKLSHYLSQKVNLEYTYLSSLFSSVEGRTIEKYFIVQRIEKAKELLIYDQLTLSQIAFDLDYSSVAHLSKQFKKITGLTATYFKEIGIAKRKSLDKI